MRYYEMLFESQKYEDMFRDPIFQTKLMGDLARNIRQMIADARRVLKKQDRIVWFLRLYRIYYLRSGRLVVTADSQIEKDAIRERSLQLIKMYDAEYIKAGGVKPNFDTTPEIILQRLEHFLSLPIPEIQNTVFRYQSPQDLIGSFGEIEHKWQENRRGLIPAKDAQRGAEQILRFPDGYGWWLLDKAYCQHEANAMGHCGNQPRANSNERLMSFRKLVKHGGQTFYTPYLTFILLEDGTLGEMKGRFNNSPKHAFKKGYSPSDFSNEILALLKLPIIKGITGGGYLPEENFKVSDLSPEQIDELGEVKPGMLPPKIQYKRYGITPDLITSIVNAVSDYRPISYDEEHKGFIWDQDKDLKKFIEYNVQYEQRNRTMPMARWVMDLLTGDRFMESGFNPDRSSKLDVLHDYKSKYPEEYQKLHAYLQKKWRNEHDEDDEDEMPDSVMDLIETSVDLDNILESAASDGYERGAENEASEAFDKWLEDLKTPSENGFYISLPQWDEKYYESKVYILIGVESIIELIDDNRLEEDDLYKPKDLEEPYYGFSGYDSEAALEYLQDNLPDFEAE